MPSISEIKAVIRAACITLERDAAQLQATSISIHSERNDLLVTLAESQRADVRDALAEMSEVFDNIESDAEKLTGVIVALRAYAARL